MKKAFQAFFYLVVFLAVAFMVVYELKPELLDSLTNKASITEQTPAQPTATPSSDINTPASEIPPEYNRPDRPWR